MGERISVYFKILFNKFNKYIQTENMKNSWTKYNKLGENINVWVWIWVYKIVVDILYYYIYLIIKTNK
jgi:hypothetical protein